MVLFTYLFIFSVISSVFGNCFSVLYTNCNLFASCTSVDLRSVYLCQSPDITNVINSMNNNDINAIIGIIIVCSSILSKQYVLRRAVNITATIKDTKKQSINDLPR